jgi:Protein of unknown function (DUF3306)
MTDEKFLARWSRRKREADAQAEEPRVKDSPAPAEAQGHEAAASPPLDDKKSNRAPASSPQPSLPSFDLSKLPSIESIAAATDIRPFLAPGVPAELTRAALRRAWTADPAIRDFIGIAENQWDFTAPDGAPGFGPLLPGDDVRRLLAQVFGDEKQKQKDESESARSQPSQVAALPTQSGAAPETAANAPILEEPAASENAIKASYIPSERSNVAEHNKDAASPESPPPGELPPASARRRHGSALPD